MSVDQDGDKTFLIDYPTKLCRIADLEPHRNITLYAYKACPTECRSQFVFIASALTLLARNFMLDVCLKSDPACLYLPAFPVRNLACQTRF